MPGTQESAVIEHSSRCEVGPYLLSLPLRSIACPMSMFMSCQAHGSGLVMSWSTRKEGARKTRTPLMRSMTTPW